MSTAAPVIDILEVQLRASLRREGEKGRHPQTGGPCCDERHTVRPTSLVASLADLTVDDLNITTLEEHARTVGVLLSHLQACHATLTETFEQLRTGPVLMSARIASNLSDRLSDIEGALTALRDGAH